MAKQNDSHSDEEISGILADTKVIAMLGASADAERPSNGVMRYLLDVGYTVVPVNPNCDNETIHGQTVYCSLDDVPDDVDLVDVFRRVDAIPSVVDEVIPQIREKDIRYLWLQLGIYHDEAAQRATDAGLTVVMNRCIKIEHSRLLR